MQSLPLLLSYFVGKVRVESLTAFFFFDFLFYRRFFARRTYVRLTLEEQRFLLKISLPVGFDILAQPQTKYKEEVLLYLFLSYYLDS